MQFLTSAAFPRCWQVLLALCSFSLFLYLRSSDAEQEIIPVPSLPTAALPSAVAAPGLGAAMRAMQSLSSNFKNKDKIM